MFYLFAVLFGFAFGAVATLRSPLTAGFFGLASHGAIFGCVSFAATCGVVGPTIAGRIFDITGSYQWAFLLSVLLAIIGLSLIILLKPVSVEGGQNESGRGA
jgi:MFS family permease